MQSFLTLVVIGLLGAAGFEYYQHTQEVATFIQQRQTLIDKIVELERSNKALKDEQAPMNHKLADLQKQQVDLQAQTSSAPAAAAPTTAAPAPTAPAAH
jgi:predicted  nucleic acid-binding Zn-ribbon protein